MHLHVAFEIHDDMQTTNLFAAESQILAINEVIHHFNLSGDSILTIVAPHNEFTVDIISAAGTKVRIEPLSLVIPTFPSK